MANIAARAGVTERTFFRYFPGKHEVLFDAGDALEHHLVDAVAAAPAAAAPMTVTIDASAGTVRLLEDAATSRSSAAVIVPQLPCEGNECVLPCMNIRLRRASEHGRHLPLRAAQS